MPDVPEEFAALLARARQNDPAALAALAQQYEPKVRLVARVLLGPALRPHLDSMDLVQSVHRSLMLGLHHGKFDLAGPDQLIALALTLVRRKVARQWRHHQRQQRLSRGAGETTDLARMLTALSTPAEDPARAAERNDQIEHLCRDLNPVERRLLELRMQGYSTAEIAQQLDLHPVALRVRMTRLRQRLQASAVLHDWL